MEQNETLENDDVLEFDYTGTDQADNLADMAENLSQDEAAAAMEAIESVRRKRADDAVRDFRQDHFHDITAAFTGRCGFDIMATQKRMRMALATADHISVNRHIDGDGVELVLVYGFPEGANIELR